MPVYNVTVRATITKTYTVEAEDKQAAQNTAHELFTVTSGDVDEHYEQDTLDIEETQQ